MPAGLLLLLAYVGFLAFVGAAPAEAVQITLALVWAVMLGYPVVWLAVELLR